jgi:hypothetical protein
VRDAQEAHPGHCTGSVAGAIDAVPGSIAAAGYGAHSDIRPGDMA